MLQVAFLNILEVCSPEYLSRVETGDFYFQKLHRGQMGSVKLNKGNLFNLSNVLIGCDQHYPMICQEIVLFIHRDLKTFGGQMGQNTYINMKNLD